MDNLSFKKILLKSAVSVMACDGEIHEDEIAEIKIITETTPYFHGLDCDFELKVNIEDIKTNGMKSIDNFFCDLNNADLTDNQELLLIEVLIRIIKADKKIDKSESQFLQLVKLKLKVNDETLIVNFPKHVDYLLELSSYGMNTEYIKEKSISSIKLPDSFNNITIENDEKW